MPAFSGPPPRRSEERRRANKDVVEIERIVPADLARVEVEVPVTPEGWHPIAQHWFASIKSTAIATLFEPSDWSMALVVGETLSRDLKPVVVGTRTTTETDAEGIVTSHTEPVWGAAPMKGASLSAYLKAFSDLMLNEATRRRLRIEVARHELGTKLPDNVTSIEDGRRAAMGG